MDGNVDYIRSFPQIRREELTRPGTGGRKGNPVPSQLNQKENWGDLNATNHLKRG